MSPPSRSTCAPRSRPATPRVGPDTCYSLGDAHRCLEEFERVRALRREGLELAREQGGPLGIARAALGEQAFAAAWAEGQAMSTEEAIACALQEEPDD